MSYQLVTANKQNEDILYTDMENSTYIFNIKVLYKQFLNKLIKMYLLKLYKTEQVHVHIVDIYQKEIEKKIEDCMGGRKLKIYFVPLS